MVRLNKSFIITTLALLVTIIVSICTIYYSYQANKKADKANVISEQALQEAKKTNNISKQSLEESKYSNLIGKEAYVLSQESLDFDILEKRVSGLEEELLNCKYPSEKSDLAEESIKKVKYLKNRNRIDEAKEVLDSIEETCIEELPLAEKIPVVEEKPSIGFWQHIKNFFSNLFGSS